MKAHTTATAEERAALAGWYPDGVVAEMEALFSTASEEAYEEALSLQQPTFAEFGEAQRAARVAAWAIIRRAQDARQAVDERCAMATTGREMWREVWQDARMNGGRVAWETSPEWMPMHRLACRCWVVRQMPTDGARRVARGGAR